MMTISERKLIMPKNPIPPHIWGYVEDMAFADNKQNQEGHLKDIVRYRKMWKKNPTKLKQAVAKFVNNTWPLPKYPVR